VTSADPPADDRRVPVALAGWLRARVLELRETGRRQRFPARLELVSTVPGSPAAPPLACRCAVEEVDDQALRVDLLSRLLATVDLPLTEPEPRTPDRDTAPGIALVHVRPGLPDPTDSDMAWLAASRCQAGMTAVGVSSAFALTRWGWVELASGERRSWVRLRR
jgi:hypothetical protein